MAVSLALASAGAALFGWIAGMQGGLHYGRRSAESGSNSGLQPTFSTYSRRYPN